MLVVPSRFAGLKIVEDDFLADKSRQPKKENVEKSSCDKSKKNDKIKNKPANNMSKTKDKKTTNTRMIQGEKRKFKKKNNQGITEWTDSKQDDVDVMDEQFYEDMLKALKLSLNELDKPIHNNVIDLRNIDTNRLEEFKNDHVMCEPLEQLPEPLAERCESVSKLPEFEQDSGIILGNDIETELEKSTKNDKSEPSAPNRVEESKNANLSRVSPSTEEIKQYQMTDIVENKDKHISQLMEQIEKMQSELIVVKTRNKKLCNIIGLGEMKTKGELLFEMEEMKEVHTELNSEIERLNALLQQERSRCSCVYRLDKRIKKGKKHLP